MTIPIWRKSSRSNSQGGACVELADLTAAVGIRDSKNPDAGHLAVERAAFAALVRRIKSGELH